LRKPFEAAAAKLLRETEDQPLGPAIARLYSDLEARASAEEFFRVRAVVMGLW